LRSNTTGNNYNDGKEVNMAKPSDVLRRLEKMAKNEFVPSIGPVKGRIITEIIKKYNPKNILEIGTLYGYSAILMATAAAADTLQAGEGKVVTIEIDRSVADIARKNVADVGLSEKINLIVGDALQVIPKLDLKFDLLFLDAAKDEYLKYLPILLVPSCYIYIHMTTLCILRSSPTDWTAVTVKQYLHPEDYYAEKLQEEEYD
jgi:predicted O-methyltransferase YrrM